MHGLFIQQSNRGVWLRVFTVTVSQGVCGQVHGLFTREPVRGVATCMVYSHDSQGCGHGHGLFTRQSVRGVWLRAWSSHITVIQRARLRAWSFRTTVKQRCVAACIHSDSQSGCVWPGAWSIHTRASQGCSYVHGLFTRQSVRGVWLCACSIHSNSQSGAVATCIVYSHGSQRSVAMFTGTVSHGMCGYVNGLFTATVGVGGGGGGGDSYVHVSQGMVYQAKH